MNYAQRLQQERQAYWTAGIATGFQQAMDYVFCSLRDPEVVGEKGSWGKERCERLLKAVEARDDYYFPAFAKPKGKQDGEAIVLREHLDRELAEIWEGKMANFQARYPWVRELGIPKKG